MFHHAVSSIEEKESNEYRPEPHEIGSESWSDDHVHAEDDQNRGDQHAANAGESCCFFDVAGATPQNGTQNAPAVEWITRKEIEDCEQKIAGAEKQKDTSGNRITRHHGGKHQYKTDGGEKKTRGWTSNRNAKLRAWTVRFVAKTRETAKRV